MESADHVGFSLSNVDGTGGDLTWKVNGVTKKYNTGVLSLKESDFLDGTKTYVIESIGPVTRSSVSANCVDSASGNAPFTVGLKIEIDGR